MHAGGEKQLHILLGIRSHPKMQTMVVMMMAHQRPWDVLRKMLLDYMTCMGMLLSGVRI